VTSPVLARQGGPCVNHMGRDPGGSAAAHLQYIRAGKVRERELASLGLLLHHLDTPAPLPSFRSGVYVSGAARVCVFVHVCAARCASHVVSPRDLWLCVLPRWQINVNVNVNGIYGRRAPNATQPRTL
jgi:hypothetical protein